MHPQNPTFCRQRAPGAQFSSVWDTRRSTGPSPKPPAEQIPVAILSPLHE